jgi:hypothetical protein
MVPERCAMHGEKPAPSPRGQFSKDRISERGICLRDRSSNDDFRAVLFSLFSRCLRLLKIDQQPFLDPEGLHVFFNLLLFGHTHRTCRSLQFDNCDLVARADDEICVVLSDVMVLIPKLQDALAVVLNAAKSQVHLHRAAVDFLVMAAAEICVHFPSNFAQRNFDINHATQISTHRVSAGGGIRIIERVKLDMVQLDARLSDASIRKRGAVWCQQDECGTLFARSAVTR